MSTSPFENAAVFTQTEQAVSSVAVSPASASVTKGQSLQLSAVVTTTGFANKAVIWSVPEIAGVSIDQNGTLKVAQSVASATEIVVTATSVYDSSVTGTATVTVA